MKATNTKAKTDLLSIMLDDAQTRLVSTIDMDNLVEFVCDGKKKQAEQLSITPYQDKKTAKADNCYKYGTPLKFILNNKNGFDASICVFPGAEYRLAMIQRVFTGRWKEEFHDGVKWQEVSRDVMAGGKINEAKNFQFKKINSRTPSYEFVCPKYKGRPFSDRHKPWQIFFEFPTYHAPPGSNNKRQMHYIPVLGNLFQQDLYCIHKKASLFENLQDPLETLGRSLAASTALVLVIIDIDISDSEPTSSSASFSTWNEGYKNLANFVSHMNPIGIMILNTDTAKTGIVQTVKLLSRNPKLRMSKRHYKDYLDAPVGVIVDSTGLKPYVDLSTENVNIGKGSKTWRDYLKTFTEAMKNKKTTKELYKTKREFHKALLDDAKGRWYDDFGMELRQGNIIILDSNEQRQHELQPSFPSKGTASHQPYLELLPSHPVMYMTDPKFQFESLNIPRGGAKNCRFDENSKCPNGKIDRKACELFL
eukprot:GHVP01006445.1.p1 GENE.GHVP01006445.1~~GHVP01006445.1.p1  ORF type:complete len:478 (+),score=67.09 GHVP01006445.1:90-1523(+)